MHASQSDTTAVLFIEGEMNIYRAHELKELLLARLAESGRLEVDLAGVSEIDSAGLQVLVLAKQAAQAANRDLRLLAHSPAVLDLFELLDMGAYFGDPLAPARCAG